MYPSAGRHGRKVLMLVVRCLGSIGPSRCAEERLKSVERNGGASLPSLSSYLVRRAQEEDSTADEQTKDWL